MHFKKIPYLILTLLLSVCTLNGCSNFLDNKPSPPKIIKISTEKLKCLKSVPEQIKIYTLGEASVQNIDSAVSCIESALVFFQQNTNGSYNTGYSVEDLRRFFGKYFLKENNISLPLGIQLMKLKKVFVGGSESELTKQEIASVIKLFKIFSEEAKQVLPHIKTLLFLKTDASLEEVESAEFQFTKSLIQFYKSSNLKSLQYNLTDFSTLLTELALFVEGKEGSVFSAQIKKWIPLGITIKNILIGKDPTLNSDEEWVEAISTVTRQYSVILNYAYHIKNKNLLKKNNRQALHQFILYTYDAVKNSYYLKRNQYLPFELINDLLEKLEVLDLLPLSLNAKQTTNLIKLVSNRLLGKISSLNSNKFSKGITDVQFSALKEELDIWYYTQLAIDNILHNSDQVTSLSVVIQKFNSVVSQNQKNNNSNYNNMNRDFKVQNIQTDSYNEFLSILKKPKYFNLDENAAVVLTSKRASSTNWSELSFLNLYRVLARLVLKGYGSSKTDSNSQLESELDEVGIKKLLNDLISLGIISFSDQFEIGQFAKLRLQEANFFTMSGNGDEQIDFHELTEYLVLFYTSFNNVFGKLDYMLHESGCEIYEKDQTNISFTCFKQVMKSKFKLLFPNAPELFLYFDDLGRYSVSNNKSQEEFLNLLLALVSKSSVKDYSRYLVDTLEIKNMLTALVFMENLLSVYDIDFSNSLSVKELFVAEHRFHNFLSAKLRVGEYSGFWTWVKSKVKKQLLPAGFVNLVINSQLITDFKLTDSDHWEYVAHLNKLNECQKDFSDYCYSYPEADRMSILRVFNELKSLNAVPK